MPMHESMNEDNSGGPPPDMANQPPIMMSHDPPPESHNAPPKTENWDNDDGNRRRGHGDGGKDESCSITQEPWTEPQHNEPPMEHSESQVQLVKVFIQITGLFQLFRGWWGAGNFGHFGG